MTAGGLMQLVAYGAQDFYLTGNPQITYFKVVYRRHTNFATESVEQTFNGSATFGGKAVCLLQRAGDLVTKMYLRAELSGPDMSGTGKQWAWVSRLGHALVNEVQLDIGGTQIDKHYGDWLNIWYELARNIAHDRGYNKMIGNTPELTTLDEKHERATVWIPLQFACCRNDGLALPVIALQYHDIKISFTFNRLDGLVNRTANFGNVSSSEFKMEGASLFVDYVYLDNAERQRFAQASHEYLFEQLQFSGAESLSNVNSKIRLNLNHPCKELVWVTRNNRFCNGNKFLAYVPSDMEATRLLASKRFALRLAQYVTAVPAIPASGSTPLTPAVPATVVTGADGLITPVTGLSTTLQTAFDNLKASIAVTTLGDVDAVTILGKPLEWSEISKLTTELFSGATIDTDMTTLSDGHPNNDVIVFQYDNYGVWLNGEVNPTQQALLQLNSHDRVSKREGDYYNYVQPWQCHTNTPCDGVNVLSFALNPEEHQPSGTCNMSRIDNATLTLTVDGNVVGGLNDTSIYLYATNYNVLRCMSGMGGLAYSN
jgi:hypothetical protein